MSETVQSAEFRTAVYELHRYLCDELAPMMVTDSVLVLMEQPPSVVAPQINAWLGSQFSRGGPKYSASDYLYHSMKKLHLLCEFDLIDAPQLREYLKLLGEELLAYCPEDDRDNLRQQFGRLGESAPVLASTPVENLYQAGNAPKAPPGATATGGSGGLSGDAVSRGLKRFSLLLERLGRGDAAAGPGQANPEVEQLRLQALVTAAVQARNGSELQEHLRQLGGAGLDSRSDQLFRMLSRSLPEWNMPLAPQGTPGAGDAYSNRSVEAMRKMVALSEGPEEWAGRFNDLVQAAIEQFNEGSLARAATMLDLADQMVAGKDRQKEVVDAIKRRAHESIQEDHLRKYAERTEDRPVLLRFMNFFSAMTPEGLLRQLHDEKQRDRRWLLLLLLETHGGSARAAALQELESYLRGDKSESHGYHQRNLVYLLRRIPADETAPIDKELEVLTQLSKPNQPSILIREAIRTLGPLKHAGAERLLTVRLREFEEAALRQPPSPDGVPGPMLEMLDTACSSLALQRTATSLTAILQHALRDEASLGDAVARLDVLGFQDLSAFPETVDRLLQTIRERLPRKILGIVLNKRESLPHLVRAVAGTPLPAVRSILEEIASKYATQEFGAEAAKALEGFEGVTQRAEPASPGLTGDTELFGLPNLFQTFSDSRVTGTLTLRDDQGRTCGVIRFRDGKILTCEYTHLSGADALYQLFEKPQARKFAFQAEPAPAEEATADALIEVVPMLMESMRRQDEYQQARALVPDGARLKVTKTKPTKLEEEEDIKLTQMVWSKAVLGSTPEQCEADVPADAFRIRRLLAHWVVSAALQVEVAEPAPVGAGAAPGGVPAKS